VDDPATGKRKQKAKGGFPTRKAAEAFLTEVKAAQLTGLYVDLRKIGFKSLCEKILTEYAPLHVGELTLRSYRSGVKRLEAHFGDRPVAAIHPADVQGLVAALARRWSGPSCLCGSFYRRRVAHHGLSGRSTEEDLTICQIGCIVRYRQIAQENSDDTCQGERGQE
jgi:hypothetical protein